MQEAMTCRSSKPFLYVIVYMGMDIGLLCLFLLLVVFALLLCAVRWNLWDPLRDDTYGMATELPPVPAYVINRVSRPDRLEQFYRNMRPYADHFSFIVVPASDVDTEPNLFRYHPTFRAGEIGCYLSHIQALRMFLETDQQWCMVFEDDSKCTRNIVRIIRRYDPEEYDVLALGVRYVQRSNRKRYDSNLQENVYLQPHIVFGSHAYLINRKGAKTLIDRAFPIEHPYDLYFCRQNDLRNAATRTTCLCLSIDDSDTAPHEGWYGFARAVQSRVRRVFRGIDTLFQNDIDATVWTQF